MATFLLRPSNSEKEAFRIKLTATSLLSLRLKPGDLCTLHLASDSENQNHAQPATGQIQEHVPVPPQVSSRKLKYAIAWEASGTGMKDGVLLMSKFLQDLYGFRLGVRIVVGRCEGRLGEAGVVRLAVAGAEGEEEGRLGFREDEKGFWRQYAKLMVGETHECVAEGQRLVFRVGKEKRVFEVRHIDPGGVGIAKVGDGTTFEIIDGHPSENSLVDFNGDGIGGLTKQVEEMQKLVSRLLSPKISKHYSPVQGVLIYGAKGVGKTNFIEQLAASGWSSVLRWRSGKRGPRTARPTLVLIDQLDMPTSNAASQSLLRDIDQLFTASRDLPYMIIGETRHPNDVDAYLRSEGKFSVEIEIPIPSAIQRKDILLTMRSTDPTPSDELLQQVADRTHGYVAADLMALLRRILELASESPRNTTTPTTNGLLPPAVSEPPLNPPNPQHTPSQTHLDTALTQIRPSALQEIFLETPSTRWTDIGGHHALKRQLHHAVTRPLHADSATRMVRLNLRPKKGILLYGPPGCSKTLLVRALANEAGVNFLAVKGAELISMYVGESERATREVFRKARAASPSIIFFDEVDAIAARKGGNTGPSSGSGGRGGGGSGGELNVLTTLLNEMDGFEELKGVFVVAATNKPERIDEALLRPGRFDNVVYVGKPDEETRREIFLKQFLASSFVAVLADDETGGRVEDQARYWAKETDGFSGAEVVAICQTAKEYALDEERDEWNSQDVRRAVAVTPKSITEEMLRSFEMWNAARMR